MATGWALTWILAHLISKKTWEEHLVTLILVLAVLHSQIRSRIGLFIIGITLWCHTPLFVGRERSDIIQGYSPVTLGLVIAFFLLVRGLLARPGSASWPDVS